MKRFHKGDGSKLITGFPSYRINSSIHGTDYIVSDATKSENKVKVCKTINSQEPPLLPAFNPQQCPHLTVS